MTKQMVEMSKSVAVKEMVEIEFPAYVKYGDIHDTGGGYDVVTKINGDLVAVSIKKSWGRGGREFEVSVDPSYRFYQSDAIEDATEQDYINLAAEMVEFLMTNGVLNVNPATE